VKIIFYLLCIFAFILIFLNLREMNIVYHNYKHQEEMLIRWNYLDKVWYQIYKNEGIYPFYILDPTDVC